MVTPSSSTPTIRERNVDGVIILSFSKALKGEGEAALKHRLDQLVREGHLRILMDLKDVPYVDSTELGRLIRCHLSVRRAGGRVRLCNLSDKVLALMKMTRLDTVLDLYPTEAEALASFKEPDSLEFGSSSEKV